MSKAQPKKFYYLNTFFANFNQIREGVREISSFVPY